MREADRSQRKVDYEIDHESNPDQMLSACHDAPQPSRYLQKLVVETISLLGVKAYHKRMPSMISIRLLSGQP